LGVYIPIYPRPYAPGSTVDTVDWQPHCT